MSKKEQIDGQNPVFLQNRRRKLPEVASFSLFTILSSYSDIVCLDIQIGMHHHGLICDNAWPGLNSSSPLDQQFAAMENIYNIEYHHNWELVAAAAHSKHCE
jgi:hypothetical protein